MTARLFELPEIPVIPVVGEDAGYPIGRIFCVGRNYAAHAAEMGVEVDIFQLNGSITVNTL